LKRFDELLAAVTDDAASVAIKKLSGNDRTWATDSRKHQAGFLIPSEMRGFAPFSKAVSSVIEGTGNRKRGRVVHRVGAAHRYRQAYPLHLLPRKQRRISRHEHTEIRASAIQGSYALLDRCHGSTS
jgi:hypothetical protein